MSVRGCGWALDWAVGFGRGPASALAGRQWHTESDSQCHTPVGFGGGFALVAVGGYLGRRGDRRLFGERRRPCDQPLVVCATPVSEDANRGHPRSSRKSFAGAFGNRNLLWLAPLR